MTSRMAVLAIDAAEPRALAEFWCAVLGWAVTEEFDVGISIGPRETTWPTIDILRVPDGSRNEDVTMTRSGDPDRQLVHHRTCV